MRPERSDAPTGPPGAAARRAEPVGGWDVPETLSYTLKRRLLGKPLVTGELSRERLSKPVALGVLSPDCISSSAYGTEEMLIELLPFAGLAAFTIVLPITGVILLILVLMTLSYRQVVQVYTKIGGSYVVARENFGPRIAQVAAVALLIDYVVTVAIQSAAGTVAVVSAVPTLAPYSVELTIAVVLLLCYGNLRGIREAGRAFALPTYLFIISVGAVIVVGVIREVAGNLPMYHPEHTAGVVHIGHGSGLVAGATILVVLRSFANGGSSLTGLEAISDGVSAFRDPTGVNARKVLVVMACALGFLVAGVSWLAHITHAAPYSAGYPSVISQEARIVFGHSAGGHVLYIIVQAASALILYTGANTSFNGFPYLASFVAADSFLPRQLATRGHRLAFSNGIIVLAVASVALLAVTGAKVNALVPFYAIGVFTGFTMAGLGMARYHTRRREAGWRSKFAVSFSGGLLSAIVVLIFAIAKFTEGAWVVVVLFPILVAALMWLNKQYRAEAAALAETAEEKADERTTYLRTRILVYVNDLDLATSEALRYGRSLSRRPGDLRAVHFMIDNVRAQRLQAGWQQLESDVPLEVVDCPDRRLARAALDYAAHATADPQTGITVLLPRRGYAPLIGRFLHDRTADRIARVLSRVPQVAATIVPFDVSNALRWREIARARRQADTTARHAREHALAATTARQRAQEAEHNRTERDRLPDDDGGHAGPTRPSKPVDPIGTIGVRQHVRVEGEIRAVHTRTVGSSSILECELADPTGTITVLFYGRQHITGIQPGARLRVTGQVGSLGDHPTITNPRYEFPTQDTTT